MTAYTHKLPSGSFTDLLRAAAAYREAPGRSVPADAPLSPQTVPERTDVGGSVAELTRLAAMSSGVESDDMPDGGIEEVFRRRLSRAGGTPGCVWDGRVLQSMERRTLMILAICFVGLAAAVAGAWALNGVFRRWSAEAGE